jgi:hypothetical protein
VPLDGCCMGTALYPDGHPVDPRVPQRTSLMAVSPSYFRTMRIPLRRGRLLTEFDASQDSPRVVIDRATAERYWARPIRSARSRGSRRRPARASRSSASSTT